MQARRARLTHGIALLLGLCGCASSGAPAAQRPSVPDSKPAHQQPAAARAPEKTPPFTEDTTQSTAHNAATFVVPAGWSLIKEADLTRVVAPEGDEPITIVDLAEPSSDAAIAAAWKRLQREPGWKIATSSEAPARDGWLGGRGLVYDVPPNAKRTLHAFALHGTQRTVVVILDSERASFERRIAALSMIAGSLRPSGYQRESFAGRSAHALDAERLGKLDELVALAQNELPIPGLALGIVQGGQVVQLRGYGVRALGKPEPVDADTLFMVASTTKALTTLLLAQLVDEGKLRWDTPVSEAMPGVRIGSEETTRALQIQHLVCACTGLPRQDWDWLIEFDKSGPSQLLQSLGGLETTTQFGTTFQYNNQLAAAAGYIAASVIDRKKELGSTYDTAMRERIFTPLDMRQSTFDFARALRGNHALAHGWDPDGKLAPIDMRFNRAVMPVRPAGGLWSSARDMLRYVQLELDRGVVAVPGSARRIVSEQNLLERRKKQVSIGEHSVYGMGLGVDKTYNVEIVAHDGGLFGFHSFMFWLPEHNVGAVMFTNSDYGSIVLEVLQRAILEQLFDGKPEAVDNLHVAARNLREELAAERGKLTIPPDPTVVSGLAAHYVEKTAHLGSVAVKQVKGTTTIDVGEWQSPIATRTNEDGSVSLVTIGPGAVGIPFVVGQVDGKRALVLRDAQHEYAFVEAP